MTQRPDAAPIPQPRPDPILGNLREIDVRAPAQSLMRLARTYGPIYRLRLPSGDRLVVCSQALVHEVSDDTRFDKKVHRALENIRDFAGDGLFTAYTEEPNWGKAHRILMSAFGPAALRDMFDGMLDIADQLVLRWERFGASAAIDVADNMTRLTLDTIALCAFGYRLNSLYQNEMHPFIGAMAGALTEAGARTKRLPIQTRLMRRTRRKYADDIRLMHEIADGVIAQRKGDPSGAEKKDLLGRMLQGRDPVTGEGLTDENIRYQMVTFLIAGHETTSGLLSFALYALLKNPPLLARARAQVDEVVGDETPRFEDLAELPYIEQVLKETLRIWPPAPVYAVWPFEDTVIGGRYPVRRDETVMVLSSMLHRDPAVWGDDPERFDPDRFAAEAEAQLPPDAWKPFGNGQRGCIGRPFAMQEAKLLLAMILQRFDLTERDPSYQLKIKETLTIKPDGFLVHARPRDPHSVKPRRSVTGQSRPSTGTAPAPEPVAATGPRTPLLVLYGSNSGSAEAFAQRITAGAADHGYAAQIGALDDYAGRLPTSGGLIVVTASYEGHPPDNAKQFVAWLETLQPGDLSGVKFGVFGCGSRDWIRTYQLIPKNVDAQLEAAGATRIVQRGEADAHRDFFGDFERWYGTLWSTLGETFGKAVPASAAGPLFEVEIVQESRAARLRHAELQPGVIVENRELVDVSSPLGRSKRHLEIALPAGMTYRAGDYLAVLPINPAPTVQRALRRFGFGHDSHIVLHKSRDSETSLPTGHPVNVYEVLAAYVELGQPATKNQVEALASATRCPPDKQALERLFQDDVYEEEILAKRVSLLDLLERYPSCELTFGAFLEMLPLMRARQYSISSTPLWNGAHCTLTVAVVDAPARSGQGKYLGVASNYLAGAQPGVRVSVAVRPSNIAFHPPADLRTPLVMICAGTGLAPFRGFLQERAIQAANGQALGRALLFFGCNHPDVDLLYRDELEAWERAGVVEVRAAFSAAPQGDVKYVQHRLWQERAEVVELFRQDARFFVCGDARTLMAGVRETAARIYQDAAQCSPEEAEHWVEELEKKQSRFYADVFA